MILPFKLPVEAASAVIINNKNQILLLKRSRKVKSYHGFWQLPEGKIKKNESGKQAILREIEEELGFKTKKVQYLKTSNFTKKWFGVPIVTITRHLYKLPKPKKIELSSEHVDNKWLDLKSVSSQKKLVPGVLKSLIDTGFVK